MADSSSPSSAQPPFDASQFHELPPKRPSRRAVVLGVDRFGNIALNLTREHLDSVAIVPGMRVELVTGGNRYYAVAARTFGDATPGELLIYEDSYRNVAIAVSRGSAAALLNVAEGGEIVIQIDVP